MFLVIIFCFNSVTVDADYNTPVKVALLGPKKVLEDNADRSVWIDSVKKYYLDNDEYCSVTPLKYFGEASFFMSLTGADYFCVQSHGSPNGINCYDQNGKNVYFFTKEDVKAYSSEYFSKAKLCLLAACETAKGSDNITQALYSKGVDCAIGYTESVLTVCNSTWIKYFNMGFTSSYSAKRSISYADMMVKNQYGYSGYTDSHKLYGDSTMSYRKGI